MSKSPALSIRQCFANVQDPRREHNRLHNLWDILALTICAVVSGADSWVEVERYGIRKQEWLETFLELPNGIPAHDTLGRVFSLMDPAAFQQGFLDWVNALVEATEGRLIGIDGKSLRHSFDTAAGKGPLHLVGAWASQNHLLLGQQAVDCKSNEITAIPQLLQIIDVSGAIVTIDAMGCQKDIAAKIIERGGDYVLSLKENQPTLHADVSNLFLTGLDNDFADVEHHYYRQEDKGHGRHEIRHYHVMPVPEVLREKHPEWSSLRTLGMVYSERQVGDDEMTSETRFFISSLRPKVKTFAKAVRAHWSIETSLHWVLDVSFREDESRLRKGHGPENLALIRRLAVSLLQNEESSKVGIACKRKEAGWDDGYLLQVLAASMK